MEIRARRDPILDGWADGWSHARDEVGFCANCGARASEPHYALKPRETPIYTALVKRARP